MTYKEKRVFKLNEISNFKDIFDDNGITYSTSNITEEMSNFLSGKKIIFEKGFFPVSLDRENIMGIFKLENIIKVIIDNNVFRYLNNGVVEKKLINIIFNNEDDINLSKNTTFINCFFNDLKIKSNNKEVHLLINNGNINGKLDLSEIQNINSIKLENIEEIKELKIENINNINILDINVKKVTKLTIKDSSFDGKNFGIRNLEVDSAEFYNTNLGEFKFNGVKFINLGFKYTTFNDCIFNNTNLPEYLDKKLETLEININSIEQKDNYRQLKHVMDKNGNHTEANKFFALEIEYYGKSLKWFSKDFLNKFIHEFQFYTSRFGNSITWSLASLLILIIFSNVINIGVMKYFYNINIDWQLNFINLLNPFFGFNKGIYESLKDIKIIYLGFVIYKILYAIIVYQLIIALKRTTKR